MSVDDDVVRINFDIMTFMQNNDGVQDSRSLNISYTLLSRAMVILAVTIRIRHMTFNIHKVSQGQLHNAIQP